MAFANRRAERGAQLYDLFMLTRFQRDDAGKIGAASLMRNLASHWRQDDITRRAGRRSWTAAPKVIDRLNWARANVVNRTS